MYSKDHLRSDVIYILRRELIKYGKWLLFFLFLFFVVLVFIKPLDHAIKDALWFTLLSAILCIWPIGMSVLHPIRCYWRGREISETTDITETKEIVALFMLFTLFSILILLAFALDPSSSLSYSEYLHQSLLTALPLYGIFFLCFCVWLLFNHWK